MLPVYLEGKVCRMIEFKNILIPVDFTVNTEIAIQKGIDLAMEAEAIIHLLHVAGPGRSASGKFEVRGAEENMARWKANIQAINPSMRVKRHVFKSSSIQYIIIECAAM